MKSSRNVRSIYTIHSIRGIPWRKTQRKRMLLKMFQNSVLWCRAPRNTQAHAVQQPFV